MLIVDTYQFRGAAPVESDALEAAAFIFNNRNALVADLATTSSLRARSVSEQGIAAGFAIADGATLDTVWLAAPDTDALGFAMASIENNLRLGLSVPVIIQFLRARRIVDARLTEPLIAEAFRQVQVKRLPPPGKDPEPGGLKPGSSNVVLASLALAGIAAGVGVALVVRRRRHGGFLGAMAFRVPENVADCKSQLKKIARNLKKAREERADAERQNYNIGVRVSDERISELTTAGRHFTEWLATHTGGVGTARGVRRRRQRAHGFAGLGSAETQELVPVIERAWGEAAEVVQKTSSTLQSMLKEAYPSLRKAQRRIDRVRDDVESRFAGIEERFWEAHPDDADVSLEDTPEHRDMNRLLNELEEGTGLPDIRESEWFGSLQHGVKELRSVGKELEQRRRKLVKVAA